MTQLKMSGLILLASLALSTHAAQRAAGPKPAALEIITKVNGSGFQATVFCTAGSVILMPLDMTTVEVRAPGNAGSPSQLLLTVHTPVTGVTNLPVTLQAAKFDKANKIGAVQDIIVKVGKAGSVSFSAAFVNGDNSKTTGKIHPRSNGVVTKKRVEDSGRQ